MQYDSDVFRIKDGRYILFSTGQTRAVRGSPQPLVSRDLVTWQPCTDAQFRVDIDEGPHATWNDATIRWRGFSWINWDGSAHRGTGQPNMMRSSDGGLHWELSNTTLYPGAGTRPLDLGAAHQGPLVLNQGADGDEGWALYFSEFAAPDYTAATGCGAERAVLHFAQVDTDEQGWLRVNRSAGPPADLALRPPPGSSPPSAPAAAVWAIALPEAQVIVCAEINRWYPGWFAASSDSLRERTATASPPPPSKNCSLAGPFYASAPLPVAGCVRSCEADSRCQGFTWKHPQTPAGPGVAVTPNCTGKAGQPCCYYQSAAEITAHLPTPLFDCWEKGGLRPNPPPPPPPKPPPGSGNNSCCCTFCTLPPECKGMGGAGVTSVCPSMMWRDPRVAAGLFTASSSSGSGAELRWHLEFATTDQTTKKELRASATVAGNGTILRLTNGTAELSPLRQFRTDGVGDGETVALKSGDEEISPYRVVWNSPWPLDCYRNHLDAPSVNFSAFGIDVNGNGNGSMSQFGGSTLILFDEDLGLYPKLGKGGVSINGGLPQLAVRNLSAHVAEMEHQFQQ